MLKAAANVKVRLKESLYRVLPDRAVNWLVRRRLPRSGQIEVTTACNLECPLCATHTMPRRTRTMPLDYAKNVIEACEHSLKWVCFHLQGEPLLNKHLFDFVRLCSARGIQTSIGTNGVLLDRYIDEIIDSGLSFVSVAIDGVDAEDYDKYRVGGDFEKVVANTKALIEARNARGSKTPVVEVQTIMFSYNEDREDEVDQFLAQFGADLVAKKRPSYFFDLDEGSRVYGLEVKSDRFNRNAERFLQLVDPSPNRKYTRESVEEQDPGRMFRNRRLCPQLERLAVLSDGQVVACCMDPLGVTTFGNVAEKDFAEIWRGPEHKALLARYLRGELDICKYCTLMD